MCLHVPDRILMLLQVESLKTVAMGVLDETRAFILNEKKQLYRSNDLTTVRSCCCFMFLYCFLYFAFC
jgi:hypothetical protein